MNKGEIKGFITLGIFLVIIYPFVFIYQQIGIAGYIVLAGIILGFFLYKSSYSKKKELQSFNELVIDVLFCRIAPLEVKKILPRLFKTNFPRSALVRNVQIIGESINIALKTKKRDVAESRMESVMTCFDQIAESEQKYLISYETFEILAKTVQDAINKANTLIYTNIASDHIDKIHKLKTIKSKKKYLELAKAILDEGLNNVQSDKIKIEELINEVLNIEKSISQINS